MFVAHAHLYSVATLLKLFSIYKSKCFWLQEIALELSRQLLQGNLEQGAEQALTETTTTTKEVVEPEPVRDDLVCLAPGSNPLPPETDLMNPVVRSLVLGEGDGAQTNGDLRWGGRPSGRPGGNE